MSTYNLTRLFALPNLKIYQIKSHKRHIYLHCHSTKKRPECVHCGDNVRIHQYLKREVKHSIVGGKLQILIIKMRRFRCRGCHKTFNESFDGIKPYKRLSEKMQREIYWACETFADLKKVRTYTSCGSKTIYKRYYTRLEEKQKMRQNNPWPKTTLFINIPLSSIRIIGDVLKNKGLIVSFTKGDFTF
jgi:transposase